MPVPIQTLPKCKCRCKRTRLPCRQPAMRNGCCRLHGGKSTGPKTEAGREAISKANLTHGRYSLENLEIWRVWREFMREN
ncbi:MAG: HGGxSTG domain-containing protein [Alphaproteobacteria bacterium]